MFYCPATACSPCNLLYCTKLNEKFDKVIHHKLSSLCWCEQVKKGRLTRNDVALSQLESPSFIFLVSDFLEGVKAIVLASFLAVRFFLYILSNSVLAYASAFFLCSMQIWF